MKDRTGQDPGPSLLGEELRRMPWVVTERSSIGGCHRYWRTSWAQIVQRQLGSKQEAIHNGRLSTSRAWGQGQSRNGLTPEMGSLVRDALGGSGSWVLVWVSQTGTHAKLMSLVLCIRMYIGGVSGPLVNGGTS